MTRVEDTQHALMTLAQHPVLKFLGGHPQAISLAAPLLQDRTLAELQQLLSTKNLDALQLTNNSKDEEVLPLLRSQVAVINHCCHLFAEIGSQYVDDIIGCIA